MTLKRYPRNFGNASQSFALVESGQPNQHIAGMARSSKVRSEDVAAIAQRLRALRATTGLSQEAFAEMCGLGYKQWGNFEAARGRIGLDAALSLVHKFRVTLDWIYIGEEYMLPTHLKQKLDQTQNLPPSSTQKQRQIS